MQGTQIQSLAPEDPLEKEMATYSSILTWEIPVGYGLWGREESDATEHMRTHT